MQLEDEIEIYRDEEACGIVDPVFVDANGRYYLIFNAPGGKTRHYYLDEHGYELTGEILIEEARNLK